MQAASQADLKIHLERLPFISTAPGTTPGFDFTEQMSRGR
jgi:hypothetical protein